LPERSSGVSERIFYDGSCGMCHRFVRFVVARDRARLFRYAPLLGETFEREVAEDARGDLPDSVVVRTERGELLTRSRATLHVLDRLGGAWKIAAFVARIVPRAIADWFYDRVASVRKRVFAAPKSSCPLLPRELAALFDP
jgi:predicted DCC family thiol-disulfide oxidoreductase YuxK